MRRVKGGRQLEEPVTYSQTETSCSRPDTPPPPSRLVLHNTSAAVSRLGFNFRSAGSSKDAPPLPPAAAEDGWWNVDHERVKVGDPPPFLGDPTLPPPPLFVHHTHPCASPASSCSNERIQRCQSMTTYSVLYLTVPEYFHVTTVVVSVCHRWRLAAVSTTYVQGTLAPACCDCCTA